jgi:hypothetical protein
MTRDFRFCSSTTLSLSETSFLTSANPELAERNGSEARPAMSRLAPQKPTPSTVE